MNRRSMVAGGLGAIAGVAAALLVVALAAVVVVEQSVGSVVLDAGRARARPVFVTLDWTLYVMVAVAGAVVGGLIARVAMALADLTHPHEARLRALPVVLLTGGLGAVTAYATLRTGLGVGGTIFGDPAADQTTVTLSVFRAIVIALPVGAVTGAVSAITGETLSRAAVVGLVGAAWPTRARFVREAAAAMVIPLLAFATVAVVVFAFSRLLLLDPGTFAVVVFSLGAALVLAGAAFLAYLGGRRPPQGE